MQSRFHWTDSLLRLTGSLALLILLSVPGCDSREAAVSDQTPTSNNSNLSVNSDATQTGSNAIAAPDKNSVVRNPADGDTLVTPAAQPRSDDNPMNQDGPKVAPLPLQFQGPDAEAKQLKVDSERLMANGIRTVTGRRLILHTDLPLDDELRNLPKVFELATQQFCKYFQMEESRIGEWQVRACIIQDMKRFERSGLLPQVLPKFQHGYALGDRVFLKEQPSEYYRRHLLIHEGTHSFMLRFFQGAGPPWYMEGMAELLATHQWDGMNLTLRAFPVDKTDVPFWGRVKIIKDDVAANRAKMIEEVMQYGSNAHLNVEAYGWSWAAAKFLDQHPQFQETFRKQFNKAGDSSPQFSINLVEAYGNEWFKVRQQWQLFVMNMEYGYDITREAIDDVPRQQYSEIARDQTFQIQANRGWQSTGLAVAKGMKIQVAGSGRFVIHQEQSGDDVMPTLWESEANGISIRYHNGKPIGTLLVAIDNLNQTGLTGLVSSGAIGTGGEIEIPQDGVLYFRINDHPAELAENSGELEVNLTLVDGD